MAISFIRAFMKKGIIGNFIAYGNGGKLSHVKN